MHRILENLYYNCVQIKIQKIRSKTIVVKLSNPTDKKKLISDFFACSLVIFISKFHN